MDERGQPGARRVFLSYRRDPALLAGVLALEEALLAEGCEVWRDERDIAPFGEIKAALHDGLAGAHALLAYYDKGFSQRRACAWELTAAMLAGAGEAGRGGSPGGRVLVVTPDGCVDHVRPRSLSARLVPAEPASTGYQAVARAAAGRLAHILEPMGRAATEMPTTWVGLRAASTFGRFVGRLEEMWDIFDALFAGAVFLQGSPAAGRGSEGTARIQSWGGVGKSVLAAEYARRYCAFYPGGVFWLQAGGTVAVWSVAARLALRPVADALGLALEAFDRLSNTYPDALQALAGARAMVGRELGRRGQDYLWIVDDLAEGALAEEAQAWLAPDAAGLGRSLFTTRDGAASGLGTPVNLGMLDRVSAYDLLTSGRPPVGEAEAGAAQGFLEAVGFYPLVTDIAGQLVACFYFADYGELLEAARSETDARILDVGEGLRLDLPGRSNPSIVATLLRSFDYLSSLQGGAVAMDMLRAASMLAPQREIPWALLADIVSPDISAARMHLHRSAMAQAGATGLTVHPVVCRAAALCSAQERLVQLRRLAVAALSRRMDAAGEADTFRVKSLPKLSPISRPNVTPLDHAEAALNCVLSVRWDDGAVGKWPAGATAQSLAEAGHLSIAGAGRDRCGSAVSCGF